MAHPAYKKRKLAPVSGQDSLLDKDGQPGEQGNHASEGTTPRPGMRNGPLMLSNGIYNSDMFQLQVDQLLSDVRPNYERRMVKAENAMRKLKDIIERIPDREPKSLREIEREQHKIHDVRIPFPSPAPNAEGKYTLVYAKPVNIMVVGSYARKTAIQVKGPMTIDLAVTMPRHIFREKDYLNYRYFHQRAYYLACIADALTQAENSTFDLVFALQNDSELQPVIIVTPGKGEDDFTKSKCRIRIILMADATSGDLFPKTKTLPIKNCVRPRDEITTQGNLPTPFYNASIRSECSSLACLNYLTAASGESGSFVEACTLGSVWLRQRDLGRGGFGPFEWASTIALLLRNGGLKGRPVLSRGYSSSQLFKATLQYLAAKDLAAGPLLIESEGTQIDKSDCPVLFDGPSGLNILFKMTPWSYATLRHEASCTLKALGDPLSDQFDACFITKIREPLFRFDDIMSLPISKLRISPVLKVDAIDEETARCRALYQALKTGLGDRARLIHIECPPKATWALGSERPNHTKGGIVQVGFLLNPENVSRTVDRGPSAEDKGAAAVFRKFWGEKAELRRFKDGSIQESLIWSCFDAGGSIFQQIVTYIIRRHVGEEAANGLRMTGDSFDRFLLSRGGR